jgi:chromosome partitioning protein
MTARLAPASSEERDKRHRRTDRSGVRPDAHHRTQVGLPFDPAARFLKSALGMSIKVQRAIAVTVAENTAKRRPPPIPDHTTIIDPRPPVRERSAARKRPARTTAILNPQGGVGSTTTAVNLGAALVKLGRRVLVVDVDPQAQASLHLGINPRKTVRTIDELLTRGDAVPEGIVHCVRGGLYLLPSSLRLSVVERDWPHAFGHEQILRRRLDPLRYYFDHILLDCPPSLGVLSLNALCASDELIVPVRAGNVAAEGLERLVDTIAMLRTQVERTVAIAGVVVTRCDGRPAIAKSARADALAHGLHVFSTVIRDNVRLAEAPSHGRDIFTYAPGASGAEDHLALAREYVHE